MNITSKLIKAYTEQRKQCVIQIHKGKTLLDSMRKNAKNREIVERQIRMLKEKEENIKNIIHELDTFECQENEFEAIDEQIKQLCIKRDTMLGRELQHEYRIAKSQGDVILN